MEYQRLKEILAKKQTEKKLVKKKLEGNVGATKAPVEKSVSITEEEEETLRNNLILNMNKKNVSKSETKGEKSKNEALSQSPMKNASQKSTMSIEIAGDSREVKLNENVPSETKDPGSDSKLNKLETDVVDMRKGLSQSLFKLSAYMSQLQKETGGVDSAIKYIAELKKQLDKAEKLLSSREKKVDSLRDVIRESHKQITVQKMEMTRAEERCRVEGEKIQGDDYKPPVEGAENIRKKLEMIRNTAMKVKTTSYSNESGKSDPSSGNNAEGGAGQGVAGAGPSLPADYRSPLEHLSQAAARDQAGGRARALDHSKELCRFDLSGKCLDDTCQLQHLSDF